MSGDNAIRLDLPTLMPIRFHLLFKRLSQALPAGRPPIDLVMAALLLLALTSARAQTEPPRLDWGKARDATTEKQLQTEAGAAKPMSDQLAAMKLPLEQKPGPGNSLYSKSIILFDGEMHTLIPVGSVLNLPENLRSRVLAAPRGPFTFWPAFLKRNSAWLGTKEVPLKMAKGDANLGQAVLRDLIGDPRLLVSVYRDCPISVLEPAPTTAGTP